LIDFRELLGEHTGENIADAVWETLGVFGLQTKVRNSAHCRFSQAKLMLMKAWAFMTDNASNMDTFISGLKSRAEAIKVAFNTLWARLRCMPHTIHLAALKVRLRMSLSSLTQVAASIQLLEAMGIVSKKRGKKDRLPGVNYQDSVNTLLTEEADNHAAACEGEEHGDEESHPSASTSILPAVDKVGHDSLYRVLKFIVL
jgi:hypothetical protein